MRKIITLAVFLGWAFVMVADAQVSFTNTSSPTVGSIPRRIVAVDVNGDGKPDLLTPDGGGNTVSVMTNNGAGGFALSSSPGTGANPSDIAAGDFNKDGKMDVVTVNYNDFTLTVLTNDGFGGFGTMATPSVGSHPQCVAVGDVNGDGLPDLISANTGDSTLTVLTNNGQGGFGLSGTYSIGNAPVWVTVADLTKDGLLDLICANENDNSITVLMNDGSGGFGGTPIPYPVGNNPQFVIAVDLNGDGFKDLAVANASDNTITVLINDENGGFGTSAACPVGNNPDGIVAADFNLDGQTDLAVANRGDDSVSVLLNSGGGQFTNGPTAGVVSAPFGIATADFNGDGEPDLATANEDANNVSILINVSPIPVTAPPIIIQQPVSQTNGTGGSVTFTVVASVTNGAYAFNYQWCFDGTNLPAATNSVLTLTNLILSQAGIYNVVVSNNIGSVTSSPAILTVISNPVPIQVAFVLSSTPGVGSQPQGVTTADVNGDGKVDLITANANGTTLTVLTNNGSGGFLLASSPSVGVGPTTVVAADVNGDGRIDLCSANYSGNSLSILTNNGSGGFGLAATPGVGSHPLTVIATDVNGDGKPDFISANNGGSSLSVLTNNGSGGFTTAGTYVVGGNTWSVAAADVNGDGKMGLIAANSSGNTVTVLTNNGSGGFAAAGIYTVGNAPQSVITADMNGDGKPDIITANTSGNTLTVLTNNGTGGFVLSGTYLVGTAPIFVAAADVNGDGYMDVACANNGNASITILTNNGSGGLVLALTCSVGANPAGLSFADVNGDGKVDLISANRGANTLSVLTNFTQFPPASMPLITAQAAGQGVLIGSTVTFSVGVAAQVGVQLFNYQWRLGGTNLPAATNNILNLSNVAFSQAGNYDVVVANSAGSVTSSPAILNVSAASVSVNGQVVSGTVTAVVSATVTITSGFPGGLILYTLDGSTPDIDSTFYNGPFTVSNSVVVQALAYNNTFSQMGYSPVVTVQILSPLNVTTPGGGSVTANGYPISASTNYANGTSITLTATPSNGWSFISWQGSTNSSSNPLNIIFNQTNSLRAIFGTVVTTNILGNGTIAFSQPNPIPFGTALSVSAVPNAGSYLVTWSSAASGASTPTTVMVTNANPAVGAFFHTLSPGEYSLNVVINGNGSVTNNPQQSYYNSGSSVVLTATNSAGVPFLGWSHDVVATNNTITVVMTNSKVIVASFGVMPTVIIATPGKLVSGQYQLTFPTVWGFTYTVQYSADLKSWSTLTNYAGSGNPITVMDPAGSTRRFYRISTTSP